MKFKVLRESYLFGELKQEGETFDYPDEHLPLDADGNIRFDKLPQLELIGPKPALKAPKAVAKATAPGKAKAAAAEPETDPETEADDDETDKPPTPEQRAASIKLAIAALDPANDAHWNTTDGLPAVKAVNEITGFVATRAEISAAEPDFKRPTE